MTEKINRCDKDGKCGAQNLDEQKTCSFFTPLKTLYRGHCAVLMNNCHCLHPEALTAKLKSLSATG